MNVTGNTNMCEAYFKHQYLTPIQGKPNFNRLHGMLIQLKSNASSVPNTLGGAVHGYVVIGPNHLGWICNRITGQVSSENCALVLCLFCIYIKVIVQSLRKKIGETAAMECSLNKLIDVTLNTIDDLVEIAELTGRPYSPTQVVDLAYMIVSA